VSDEAERKVRQWALRRNGDPLEPHDVVELVFAFADDHEADYKKLTNILETHVAEANVRDARLNDLETWRREQALTCSDKVVKLVKKELCDEHHRVDLADPVSMMGRHYNDPPDSEFTEKRESAFPLRLATREVASDDCRHRNSRLGLAILG
jgi:hypothetical protein